MKTWGVERKVLETIAKDLGFRLNEVREGGVRKPWVAFTLRMATPLPSKADQTWADRADTRKLSPEEDRRYHYVVGALQYRARSWNLSRWSNGAVCWHGHKAFLDRVVEHCPSVRVESKLWKFNGAEEYRAKVDATGMVVVGSQFQPIQARECCDCYGG